MGPVQSRHPRSARRHGGTAAGKASLSLLPQRTSAPSASVLMVPVTVGRQVRSHEQAGDRMRRLASTRPRKRCRRYQMVVLMQRQCLASSSTVRIRPAKRIFRPATPFHF